MHANECYHQLDNPFEELTKRFYQVDQPSKSIIRIMAMHSALFPSEI